MEGNRLALLSSRRTIPANDTEKLDTECESSDVKEQWENFRLPISPHPSIRLRVDSVALSHTSATRRRTLREIEIVELPDEIRSPPSLPDRLGYAPRRWSAQ